jgi:hypothetical protein
MLSVCLTLPTQTKSLRKRIASSSRPGVSPTHRGVSLKSALRFSMAYDAIRAHGSLDVGLPPGPDFFGCGRPNYAAEMLRRAGFLDVSIKEVPLVWRVSSPDAIIDFICDGTVRTAAVLGRQSPQNLEKIRQGLRERVLQFERNGIYAVPAPASVVAARKSD